MISTDLSPLFFSHKLRATHSPVVQEKQVDKREINTSESHGKMREIEAERETLSIHLISPIEGISLSDRAQILVCFSCHPAPKIQWSRSQSEVPVSVVCDLPNLVKLFALIIRETIYRRSLGSRKSFSKWFVKIYKHK